MSRNKWLQLGLEAFRVIQCWLASADKYLWRVQLDAETVYCPIRRSGTRFAARLRDKENCRTEKRFSSLFTRFREYL